MSMSSEPSSTYDWNDAVTEWFNEYEFYTYGPLLANHAGPATGHYTQVLFI